MAQNNLRRFKQEYSLEVNINRIRQIYRGLLRDEPQGVQGQFAETRRAPLTEDDHGRQTSLA